MVMQSLMRKARHVLDDPVLRRWLMRRLVGLEKAPPAFVSGQPTYLGAAVSASAGAPTAENFPPARFPEGNFVPPRSPTRISLPDQSIDLTPDDPDVLFTRSYDDLETLLAAHRFAWVPVAGDTIDGDWVAALWDCWTARFGIETSGWPWHAYTAAERAINIIDFSRRFGLPGDPVETRALLLRHADIIRGNLEYFGDHYTSNHLSNNGRGLLRIGTAFGHRDHADTGAKIMVAEAGRIFGRSGVLREGSTHYHLLVTRNYIDAWLDAQAAGLEQSGMLRDIAERALAVVPGLCLPGGMPLIGDISPDASPEYLGGLTGSGDKKSWPANLSEGARRGVLDLVDQNVPVSPDKLAEDGWHRFGGHSWQVLAFVAPGGWPPMPGHGHQDLGSFELHDGDIPVIVDPGRGSYAESAYETAAFHNGIMLDGTSASPINRPYYSASFRHRMIPRRPEMTRTRDGQFLSYTGIGGKAGTYTVDREWRFIDNAVEIYDRFRGSGQRKIRRQFIVPGTVNILDNRAIITIGENTYQILGTVSPNCVHVTIWEAYGCGRDATAITFDQTVMLPFEGKIEIKHA